MLDINEISYLPNHIFFMLVEVLVRESDFPEMLYNFHLLLI
jgi:hypothetical protein